MINTSLACFSQHFSFHPFLFPILSIHQYFSSCLLFEDQDFLFRFPMLTLTHSMLFFLLQCLAQIPWLNVVFAIPFLSMELLNKLYILPLFDTEEIFRLAFSLDKPGTCTNEMLQRLLSALGWVAEWSEVSVKPVTLSDCPKGPKFESQVLFLVKRVSFMLFSTFW